MNTPRIIKKYPNRRLYDTGVCRYIDLNDVRQLVADRTDFIVIDKKTGEDITRSTLLLVITSVEQEASSVMSQPFLLELIRIHGTPEQVGIANALERAVSQFA